MSDAPTIFDALGAAHRSQRAIRVRRESLDDEWIDGFVAGYSQSLLVLHVVDPGGGLDGYQLIRMEHVSSVDWPAPQAVFIHDNMAILGVQPVPLDSLPLDSMGEALAAIATLAELIVVHPEQLDPGICYVGHPLRVDDDTVTLLEIDADAVFGDEPADYLIEAITKVEFGSGYARALARVAWAAGTMPGFGSRWQAAYALVGTHLLDVELGDDVFELSVQLFERAGSPGRYRATVRRGEYRQMPATFPSGEDRDGEVQHLTDTVVYHDWAAYLDLDVGSFPAYDSDHALHLVLASVDRTLARIGVGEDDEAYDDGEVLIDDEEPSLDDDDSGLADDEGGDSDDSDDS